MQKISIICPIYQEARFISAFLDSLLEQDYPRELLEIFLIDGMSDDGTRDIIARYEARYSCFHMLDNPMHTVPYALNAAIRQATGDIVIRLDAHCKYPANYVSSLAHWLVELHADNVGGVWRTHPANNSAEALAVALCSSHPFGVGGSEHKVGASGIKQVDTVPFGCYRRDVFSRIGLFDEELTRNQDDEFNARLINNGGKIFLIPSVVIDYTARENMRKMRKMYYQYGLFKPLVNRKLGSPATVRQFFPALFCIGIVLGALLSCLFRPILWMYVAVMAIYFAIGIIIGAKKALLYKRASLVLWIPYTFLNIHLSYGIGYLYGVYKVATGKSFNVKVNR